MTGRRGGDTSVGVVNIVVRLHQRYCTPFQVRAAWGLLIANTILMLLLAALAR